MGSPSSLLQAEQCSLPPCKALLLNHALFGAGAPHTATLWPQPVLLHGVFLSQVQHFAFALLPHLVNICV